MNRRDWFYEGKDEDWGFEPLMAHILYLSSGNIALASPYVTEERFFDWLDETFGADKPMMILNSQEISEEMFERLKPRFEDTRLFIEE